MFPGWNDYTELMAKKKNYTPTNFWLNVLVESQQDALDSQEQASGIILSGYSTLLSRIGRTDEWPAHDACKPQLYIQIH